MEYSTASWTQTQDSEWVSYKQPALSYCLLAKCTASVTGDSNRWGSEGNQASSFFVETKEENGRNTNVK